MGSPSGRARTLSLLRERAARGGAEEKLRKRGLTVDQWVMATAEEETKQFEFDCRELGFQKVGLANDQPNEAASRRLKATIDAQSRVEMEQQRAREMQRKK